jgi:hypothetical protein
VGRRSEQHQGLRRPPKVEVGIVRDDTRHGFSQAVAGGLADSHIHGVAISRQLVGFIEDHEVVALAGKTGFAQAGERAL